jgi:hypothetical protein
MACVQLGVHHRARGKWDCIRSLAAIRSPPAPSTSVQFWKTPLGRDTYFMNLRQIVDAIHTTAYFGVMQALLRAHNEEKLKEKRYGEMSAATIYDIQQDDKFFFALVQKDLAGLYTLDAELKKRMQMGASVVPNSWIFPSEVATYAAMTSPLNTDFLVNGQDPRKELEIGARRYASFRGSRVFETRPFKIDFLKRGIEPLHSLVQVGEYYFYNGREFAEYNKRGDDTVHLYDIDLDRFIPIGVRSMVRASFRFNHNGLNEPGLYEGLRDDVLEHDTVAVAGRDLRWSDVRCAANHDGHRELTPGSAEQLEWAAHLVNAEAVGNAIRAAGPGAGAQHGAVAALFQNVGIYAFEAAKHALAVAKRVHGQELPITFSCNAANDPRDGNNIWGNSVTSTHAATAQQRDSWFIVNYALLPVTAQVLENLGKASVLLPVSFCLTR